jgi:mRNA interferase MazF
VVLLSRDEAYGRRASYTVAPVTSKVRGIRVEVPVGSEEGLRRESVVNLDDIQTVHRSLIRNQIGRIAPHKMRAVEDALAYALALPPYAR